ncbi:MAG: hypothetical protein ACK42C_09510 [Aquificaceae bacterium]|jgi:predicted  nucleic acid-binding Zn-ribbon protein|uniref:hypothetical protein n=1 Tax=Hydrogenobacter sp. Uz 6-8 TaxID=3384828 RepID=UPI000F2CBCEF|nr:MAG: hypothetical protein D6804_06900 [Aquificota bacterium]
MTKEFEIGINLLKRVQKELEELSQAQDRLEARRIVNTIVNPVTASAYQIRVGEGPYREELLESLLKLVKDMRELSDMNGMKETIKRLLQLVREVEEATAEKKEG